MQDVYLRSNSFVVELKKVQHVQGKNIDCRIDGIVIIKKILFCSLLLIQVKCMKQQISKIVNNIKLQVRSVYFPRELLRPASLLTNLVLDDTRAQSTRLSATCDNIFAYISDTVAPGNETSHVILMLE